MEAEAQAVGAPILTSREVAESLADLRVLFLDAEPTTKHRIVQALFEHVEVLGPNEVWLYPSVEAEARGWAAAMSGEFRAEVRKTGRGERTRPRRTDMIDLAGSACKDQVILLPRQTYSGAWRFAGGPRTLWRDNTYKRH